MLAFRAKYVFAVDGPPLRDGVVAIDHDRIVAVGESSSPAIRDLLPAARDLGDIAILPGLVNPHTHLEFSDLRQPLGTPGMAFPDWIHRVVAHKRNRGTVEGGNEDSLAAIVSGIGESNCNGVTTIGDIESIVDTSRAEAIAKYLQQSTLPLEVVCFLEAIGLRRDRISEICEFIIQTLSSRQTLRKSQVRLGLSPHAPYTVHPDLLNWCVLLSAERQIPLVHHLAESREELMLLRSRVGPFVGLLKYLEAWDPDAIPFGSRPMDYLQTLSKSHRALVIHGNYLDDEEIGFLGAHADNMSVVYCPRTHAYFQHDPYPLAKMLVAGANVAIGTDSRASNPDLSVLTDMRFAAKQHSIVPPATLLRMITANAARALGRDGEIGTLTPGKFADLAILALPKYDSVDPHELLLDANFNAVATVFRGRQAFGEMARFAPGGSPGAK